MDKAAMRALVRANRRDRPNAERELVGALLADAVMALPEVGQAVATGGAVAAYLSMPTEPSTAALLGALRRAGCIVTVPRVTESSLAWVEYDVGGAVERSPYGMDEPVGPSRGAGAAGLRDCAVIIVPALAVDVHGRRLGQGGGYYDRLIADLPHEGRPLLVALVHDDEIVAEVPTDPHDLTVDVAITPTQTLRFHTPAS